MNHIRNIAIYRSLITRIVFLFILVMLIWRYYSYNLPHQLASPVLLKIGIDPNYWLYMLFNLQYWVVENYLTSQIFSYSLIAFCLTVIISPNKIYLIVLFTILYYIYSISYRINLTFHSHHMSAMMLIIFCFWPKKDQSFEFTWDFARYYACWVYT